MNYGITKAIRRPDGAKTAASSVTASELLDEAGITPDKAMMFCGRKAHALPAVRQLVRMSGKPFLLVGTAKELKDSCLCALNPDWVSKETERCPDEGSGVLTLAPGTDIGGTLTKKPTLWDSHLVILCLGGGLQADKTLLTQMNMLGGFIILTDDLPESVNGSNEEKLTVSELLRSMRYVFASTIGAMTEAMPAG